MNSCSLKGSSAALASVLKARRANDAILSAHSMCQLTWHKGHARASIAVAAFGKSLHAAHALRLSKPQTGPLQASSPCQTISPHGAVAQGL
eukprot:8545389-Pyramimonas_sp.AAC.1